MNKDLQELIEKYAARKAVKKSGFTEADIDQDRELIRRAQEQGDKFAMNELVRKYRGLITQSVQKSQLSFVMDNAMAQQYAVGIFKDLIKNNFDLKKENKPSTYLLTTLPEMLKKKRYEFMDTGARKSAELTRKNQYKFSAEEFLRRELNREPTIDEIYSYITDKSGLALKVDKKELIRINQLNRRELSGDEQVGGDTQAEFLTLRDIKNVDRLSPEEVFNNSLLQQRIESVIQSPANNFTRQERKFIRYYAGLGEFKGRAAKSPNDAALSNGMTYYEARRILDRVRKLLHLDQEG